MKTKIDARREREAYDKTHPWQPMPDVKSDGTVCELLFSDMAGMMVEPGRWVFHEDGHWYRIDGRAMPYDSGIFHGRTFYLGERRPMNWRAIPGAPTADPEAVKRRQDRPAPPARRGW